jgi:hypothetical protein
VVSRPSNTHTGKFDNEGASEENCWLVNTVMLVADTKRVVSGEINDQEIALTHLNVPTPPASSRKDGPSPSDWPAQRCAKARRMWPWATISTSPLPASPFGFPMTMTGECHFSRISLMSRSRRSVISEGLLRSSQV